jgi:hypothetical protein
MKKLILEEDSLVNRECYSEIYNVLKKYKIESAVKYTYLINLYLPNRNLLDLLVTMNYALKNIENFGDKEINDYNDLIFFVEEIRGVYKQNPFNTDIQVHDFGEVYISFNKKSYPIIIGTGHNHSYVFNCFLDEIARKCNTVIEIEAILEFYKLVIETFKECMPVKYDEYSFDIVPPSENIFNLMYKKYCDLVTCFCINNIHVLMKELSHSNQLHYFVRDNNVYLLFNTSLIIDFVSMNLKRLNEEEQLQISNSTIINQLVNSFEPEGNQDRIIYRPLIFDNPKEKPRYIPFLVILQRGHLYIVFNEEEYSDKEKFRKIKEDINTLLLASNLYIGALEKDKYKVFPIDKEIKIYYIQIINHININEYGIYMYEDDGYIHFTALDFMYFILRSEDFAQIDKFIIKTYLANCMNISPDGISGLFEMSLQNDGLIETGALHFGLTMTDLYMAENKILDLFKEEFNCIPYLNDDLLFDNPFEWSTRPYTKSFRYVKRKGTDLVGCVRRDNLTYVFICRNTSHFTFEEMTSSNFNSLISIDDLLVNMLDKYWEELTKNTFFKKGVQLFIIPKTKSEEYKVGLYGYKGNYICGDLNLSHSPNTIRISIDKEKLFKDIMKTEKRDVECSFFIELFRLIDMSYYDCSYIIDLIKGDFDLPKLTNVMEVKLTFYKNLTNLGYWGKDENFINIKKRIAIICKNTGIKSQDYRLNEAKHVIRTLQNNLIPDFIELIKEYNRVELHIKLLSLLASLQYDLIVRNMKIHQDDSNVDKELSEKYRKINISGREDSRNKIRYLLYLMENNLKFNDNNNNSNLKDINDLLAYTDWLIVLQDNSDMFHWNIDSCSIEVDYDYRVNTIFDEKTKEKNQETTRRVYNSITYFSDLVKPVLENDDLLEAYKQDFGYDFRNFIKVMSVLFDTGDDRVGHEVYPDVVKYEEQELIDIIVKNNIVAKKEIAIKILNDITIVPDTLNSVIKNTETINHNFIPIWEREYRPNRLELKPLFLDKSNYYFSPIACYANVKLWINALSGLYPPHESRIPNILETIESEKMVLQKTMVVDIKNLFDKHNFSNVYKEYKLHKHGTHPEVLGDYDVLAIDKEKKTIWNIESKVLQHVGSISEYAKHQETFFLKHNSDVKFEGRIKYLEDNIEMILKEMNINYIEGYVFKHYMVTNKVFVSEYKDVSFSIITYHELKDLLKYEYQ